VGGTGVAVAVGGGRVAVGGGSGVGGTVGGGTGVAGTGVGGNGVGGNGVTVGIGVIETCTEDGAGRLSTTTTFVSEGRRTMRTTF